MDSGLETYFMSLVLTKIFAVQYQLHTSVIVFVVVFLMTNDSYVGLTNSVILLNCPSHNFMPYLISKNRHFHAWSQQWTKKSVNNT